MTGEKLLKALGAIATGEAPTGRMPPHLVRFVLEYNKPPNIAAERAKLAEFLGTESFSFDAMESDADVQLARFAVLQFAGVVRVFSDQALYEMATALKDRLHLVSCEPDVGARVYAEPDARDFEEMLPESAVVDLWCWSKASAPGDKHWALAAMRVQDAWKLSDAMGAGILVGQPDTGVADHPEIEETAIEWSKAANILEGGRPLDPLDPSMANPGHGTATASVVISRPAGQITGTAPAAKLAPVRCTNDVKIFDGAPIAAAVSHARKSGCDVITMSLGGIPSISLAAAIGDATDAGAIVLAAAGNCVGVVTYPALDERVIAVAGVDSADKPWIGSCRGSAVDISAPAENVYVARRTPGDGGKPQVDGGQGTSFAVALTAGVAALWLSHHGRDAVRNEARRRGISIQALFRAALQQTARRPQGWDPSSFGAGVVDAEALLKLGLRDIAGDAVRLPAPIGDVELVWRKALDRKTENDFDWAQHGAEAALLALKADRISRRASAGMETVGDGGLRPSAEVAAKAPPVLLNLLSPLSVGTAPTTAGAASADTTRLLKLAGKQAGGGVESAASVSVETAMKRLKTSAHKKGILDKLDAAMSAMPTGDPALEAERKRVVGLAESGVDKLATDGPTARLTVDEHFGLEALVSLHDRPALRVRGGVVDINDPLLGDWVGAILTNEALLSPMLAAVGRIDLDGGHVGTGFVVAPGCIMTNRHVLEVITEEFRAVNGASQFHFLGSATINFSDDGVGPEKSFKIKSVLAAGAERIDERLDFLHLDMALMEVESTNGFRTEKGDVKLPTPMPLARDIPHGSATQEIFVAGFPARPPAAALRDPVTKAFRQDVATRLGELFGMAYSVKYLSPGEIRTPLGKVEGDPRAWVFAHDATTLGGNSGSWVMRIGEPFGVIGLHFGGGTLRANYAHGVDAVSRSAQSLQLLASAKWI